MESEFRSLADALPQIVWETDADGVGRYFNRRWSEYTGREPGTFVERMALVHPDDRARVIDAWRTAVVSRSDYTFEHRFRRHDGVYRWFLSRAVPVKDAGGNVLRWFGTSTDVHDLKLAQEALGDADRRKAEYLGVLSRYRTLFESIDEGFCIIEVIFDEQSKPVDYRFLEVNPAFERHTGLVDVRGKRMREMVPGHDAHWFETYGRIALTGEPARFENRAEALGRWYDVYAFRFGDPEDRQVAVLFTDISERRRAEEELRWSEATLAAFFGASPGILNIVDDQLRYLRTDATTPTYFGLTQESILGKSVAELAPEFTTSFEPMMRAVIDTGVARLDQKVFAPVSGRAGEVATWRASYFPVPLGPGRRGLGVIGVEITDLEEAEAARTALVEALRREDARKTEFLGVLSHELRNPLTPIRNSLYILDRVAPGGDQARRAQVVISRQVDQLARLVDDLLEITRVTSNKVRLQRERIELGALVLRTLEDHRSTLDRAGLTMKMRGAPERVFVNGDPSRLAQVIGNLLQNAAKFTPAGGHVTLSLSQDAVRGHAVLRVTDTGVGLTPELLENLFQPFSQGEQSLDRSRGGLGIGLALVKGLVELHGGEVRARSDGLERGSEFTVCLPLDRGAEVQAAVRSNAHGTRRRVLVVEGDLDAADSLREVIELDGHEVVVAYDGPAGIAKAREFRPDVVLCDVVLPTMDGYAVARTLRSDDLVRHARLIALDDRALSEDLQRANEAGFERHITKPPSLDALASIFSDDGRG